VDQIILATNNDHKTKEFKKIFNQFGIEIKSLKDVNISIDIEETGSTFFENSLIKAEAIRKFTALPILADDSGLVIPELNNEPGVYSARYAGLYATDEENRQKVLKKVVDTKLNKPSAYFACALTLLTEKAVQVEGHCNGFILTEERGENGFGYDPIFCLKGTDTSLAELTETEKNRVSHRAHAIALLLEKLNLTK